MNGQQCEVKKAQSKTDDGMSRGGGGPRGTFKSDAFVEKMHA